jgi:nitrogen fixation NifU-like protein
VYLLVEEGIVRDIGFQGAGCAISTASASMMTESIKGKSYAEVEALFHRFHDLVTGKELEGGETPSLGKLAVFAGVREYPVRVKCASLAWHTLHAALEGDQRTVATE